MYKFQEVSILEILKILPYKRRENYKDEEVFYILNHGAWGLIQIWMKLFRIIGPAVSLLVLMLFSANYSIVFFVLLLISLIVDFLFITVQTRENVLYNEKLIKSKSIHEGKIKNILNNVEFFSMNGNSENYLLENKIARKNCWLVKRKTNTFNALISFGLDALNNVYRIISYSIMQGLLKDNGLSSGQLGAADSIIENARIEAKLVKQEITSTPSIIVPIEKLDKLLHLKENDFCESSKDNLNEVVRFANVSVKLNEKYILRNISFGIAYGEKVALIGNNGAGKSTLIKTILNLIPINSGSIELYGESLNRIYISKFKQFLSYSPSQTMLFSQPVWKNIMMGSQNAIKNREIRSFLKMSSIHPKEIDSIIDKDASLLSGGEAQRVSIARSLCNSKQLLLLDEPTAALDRKNADIVMSNLNDCDKTVIFTTHRSKELIYATRVILIENGEIVCDLPRKVFVNTNHYLRWKGKGC